jgi:hypothetical protein
MPTRAPRSWPELPYRGLNFFTAAEALLFGERDQEVQECDDLVSKLRTRMLLVHGRSGTGKSSFVRAGLIPRLVAREVGVALEAPNPSDGALVIRCTADPVARTAYFIKEAAKQSSLFSSVPEDGRRVVRDLLAFGPEESRVDLADRLVQALALLTRHLSRPLLLVIDQGEEVLTLPDRGVQAKEAFFGLLEELCWQTKIGIKIIFVLRTEYYGQFCDHFRLDPQTKLSAGHSGVEQFMLHGLQNEEVLASAISRPTLDTTIGGLVSPRRFYKFKFSPGLPEQIARDLIEHCGESSTLPVMQIVCTQLYERVREAAGEESTENTIGVNDYKDLGFVAGALDAFVESRIRDSISKANLLATKDNVEAWRGVLGSLVAKQEGGVLTTLIVTGEKLIRAARDCGLKGPLSRIIRNMAHERCRLLRPVDTAPESGGHRKSRDYSLGHDALAIALLPWADVHERLAQATRETRQRMRRVQIGAVLTMLIACVVVVQLFSQKVGSSETLRTFADLDQSGNYGQRLMLLNASLTLADGPARWLLDTKRTLTDLRTTLERSPLTTADVEAFALEGHTSRLATLDGDRVRVRSMEELAGEASKPVEYVLRNPNYTLQSDDAPSNLPMASAVGFVKDLAAPVAYKGGHLYYWLDGEGHSQALAKLLPEAFRSALPLGIEIVGGIIRVWQWRFGANDQDYVLIHVDKAQPPSQIFRTIGPLKVSWRGLLPPTYSTRSSQLAYLDRLRDSNNRLTANAILRRIDFLDPHHIEEFGTTGKSPGNKVEEPGQTTEPPEAFVQSIAFPVGTQGIVTRSDKATLEYFSRPGAKPVPFQIPAAMQGAQRPSFFVLRPVLAAHNAGDRWLFAWMAPEGIHVMASRSRSSILGSPAVWPPLLVGNSGPETGRQLAFSSDGRYLLLMSQRGFREKQTLRLYDLSDDRRGRIAAMDEEDVQREACRVAKLDQFSATHPARSFVRRSFCD